MSLTATHGKNAYIEVRLGNSGSYTNITDKCHNASAAFDRDTSETSTFGTGDKTFVPGMRGSTLSVDYYTDPALRDLLFQAYLSDTPLTVRYGPEGNATGKERMTSNFFITQFGDGGTISSVVGGSCSLQRTGATTRDTWT